MNGTPIMKDRPAGRSGREGGPPEAAPAPRSREGLMGRKALVLGLARSGLAVSRFLASRGAAVTAADRKGAEELPGAADLRSLGVDLALGGAAAAAFDEADLVVASPGVPWNHPVLAAARDRGAEVIGELELASRFIDCPVVAVAGTNGKSTTTTLVGEMLKNSGRDVFVGGNIGTPAVECAERDPAPDLCVLEVSSFQLETTATFRPRVGVLLNITPDHLDRYEGFDHYAATKFRLFANQEAGDYAVINADDPLIAARALEGLAGGGRLLPFSASGRRGDGLWLADGEIVYSFGGTVESYSTSPVALKGLHNMENVMAAVGAARLAGASPEAVRTALAGFKGLPHRMELVRVHHGVAFVNDSKGTNTGALEMALKGADGPVVLIAGGVDKGGDYAPLAPLVREKVRLLVLIGEAAGKMEAALGGSARTVRAPGLEDAVAIAYAGAREGDTVLLCPACSSFDMFRDYEDRGDRFRRCVERL